MHKHLYTFDSSEILCKILICINYLFLYICLLVLELNGSHQHSPWSICDTIIHDIISLPDVTSHDKSKYFQYDTLNSLNRSEPRKWTLQPAKIQIRPLMFQLFNQNDTLCHIITTYLEVFVDSQA